MVGLQDCRSAPLFRSNKILAAMTGTLRSGLFLIVAAALPAQVPAGPMREVVQLDLDGKGAEARQLLQKIIDSAATAAARASAQRAMAMSWAFEGNCRKTAEYEQMVIRYWMTQEKDSPGNAFYQEGEMANEAARVCIDSGDLDAAAELYRKGYDFGLKEPGISADRRAVWEFRWEHAQARVAARRGNRSEAEKHVAAAQSALDKMTQSRRQQDPFFPYLTGYVSFYLGDYTKAVADLQQANQSDPFIQCLLGHAYEKLGKKEEAMECYRKASLTTAHNPPAAYARPFARSKLGDSKIEFENGWVRVVRVHYDPHEKTEVHDHPATPTVYVYVTDGGRLRLGHDGAEPTVRPPVKMGGIRFQKGVFERHWVEELDGVESEYLRVELKTRQVDLPDADVRRAPGDRNPYEGGMIRILRVTCAAKSPCPVSSHTQDPAVIVQKKGFIWQAAGDPPMSNTSDAPQEQVRIELKTEPLK